ncbi:MAG: hypothetical protein RIE24_23440 [Silicimonas sp.]|uniref:hypothetical protein n=2 Tax=Roseobacteraceae TaxID=2854170 RepID=UPI001268B794|nr:MULTISPECIES: hypothetical protein [Roseovarius]
MALDARSRLAYSGAKSAEKGTPYMTLSTILRIDKILLGIVAAVLLLSVVIYFYSTDYFSLTYAREDGLVEYSTALFLCVASVVLVMNARSLKARGAGLAFACTLFYALVFFFAAGEEISWGQRIIGWETGETFEEMNKQQETNLHNLIVPTPWGDFHLAKTLFGPILTLIVLVYITVLPLLYLRVGWIKRAANHIAAPVPGTRHAMLAVTASLVIAVIDVPRKWEVYELVFSLLATSIFLLPQNSKHTTFLEA